MRQQFHSLKDRIISVVDFFYPPFSRVMNLQNFRYAACGGTNTLFDIFLYFITYNYVLQKEVMHFGPVAISPHIASFMLTFPVTFTTGFLLARYVVFPEASATRKRIQVTRYLLVVFFCILLNYVFLKLFVEVFGWWPLPSKIATTVFVVAFSYVSQRKFAFRVSRSL